MCFKKQVLKVLVLITVISLAFCGCKNKEDTSSFSSEASDSDVYTEATSSGILSSNEESSATVENIQSVPKENITNTPSAPEKKEVKAKGIDVSKWQGKIDWKKVKSAGIDFAIIRIGQRAENGKIIKDDFADYNIQQADKNGILIGVYFFSTAISSSEASEEAQWVAENIKSYPISYPVVWDCEGFSESDSRMFSLTNEQRTANAVSFLNKIESLGYEGMFYGSATELSGSLKWNTPKIEASFKIWLASYPQVTYPQISVPDYQGKYDMWQYTDKGAVSGIKGNTDMVVSYFAVKKAAAKSNKAAPVASAPKEIDNIYTSTNEKVTAKDVVNLRDSASTKGNVVGSLKNGDVLTRTATGANGWSKLSYNGKTVYAVSSYLTTDLSYKPPTNSSNDGFKPVNEKVTAKDKTNLRSVPNGSDSGTVVYTLKNGEVAVRIGVADSGWSKVTYGGKTLYAISSYLTTDLSYKPPVESNSSSETSSSGLKTTFTDVDEQVTAKSETNLRSLPSVTDSEVIYTLKNGEYVTRTGVSSNGWSRLEYNGKTVYAVSSYLTK